MNLFSKTGVLSWRGILMSLTGPSQFHSFGCSAVTVVSFRDFDAVSLCLFSCCFARMCLHTGAALPMQLTFCEEALAFRQMFHRC